MNRCPPLLHDVAGHPSPRKTTREAAGTCYWCGQRIEGHACRTRDVFGSSFTDHDQAAQPSSPWCCVACSWACTGRPPDTLRLWSVVYREDGYVFPSRHPKAADLGPLIYLATKATIQPIVDTLLDPPPGRWVVSVADSGQKHVVPFAIVNNSQSWWRVRFESVDVSCSVATFRRVAGVAASLYHAGYPKAVILGDPPGPGLLRKCGIDLWRAAQRELARYSGSSTLELAVWMLRKENCLELSSRFGLDVGAGRPGACRSTGPAPRDAASSRPGRHRQPSPVLGTDPVRRGSRSKRSADVGGDVDVDRPQAATPRVDHRDSACPLLSWAAGRDG